MTGDVSAVAAVCLVLPGNPDTLTGGYVYDCRILRGLAESGWNTTIISLDSSFPTPTDAALAQARAQFDAMPDGHLVVIDGLALAGLLPLLPEIATRLEPIALIHHPLADETGIDAALAASLEAAERAALAEVRRVIVTSPWTRRRLADYDVEPERIAVVIPGVDRSDVVSLAPTTSTVRLLTVATITPRKGHDLLIAALAELKDLDWSLRLAGSADHDPRYAGLVRAQVERSGLVDRVSWLGELSPERVAAEYAGADLFVLPSYLEGYGMALAEAIAHGLPVVSTTAGAIPDTVPATAACLVSPGAVDQLTAVLRELIANADARARLTQGALAAAEAVPTWAESAARFGAFLKGNVTR